MLNRQERAYGFSIIAVTGTLIIISLLMVTALQLVQDHVRRAALSADYALALRGAEAALAAAECELAVATGTPTRNSCNVSLDDARMAALDPVTLAGFIPGRCGQGAEAGLCWPLQGQPVQALAGLLENGTSAVTVPTTAERDGRTPTSARYVIEPIPDALPGEWIRAGATRAPSLFRITAAGFGLDTQVNVMLQTVYRPRGVEP